MVRPLIAAFIGALFFNSARADLELMPSISQYELDGAKFKQLAFFDGDQVATYQSPRGWHYSGSLTQLTLHPPDKTEAEATITRIPLSEAGKFDEESTKKLVAGTIAAVPKGSEDVTVISQEKNPLLINRKETFLVVLGYNFSSRAYKRSILFLNRGNEQIRFQLNCRGNDFSDLQKAFLGSQYSWHNL